MKLFSDLKIYNFFCRLQIDISELQNQELLGVIQKLETGGPIQRKSEPDTGEELEKNSVALLRMEIERTKEDNERLSNIIQDLEDKAELYKEEKDKLSEKLSSAHREIHNYKLALERSQSGSSDSVVKEMDEKLKALETLLSIKNEESSSNQETLKMELLSTKEKMNRVEAQLQLAEMVRPLSFPPAFCFYPAIYSFQMHLFLTHLKLYLLKYINSVRVGSVS